MKWKDGCVEELYPDGKGNWAGVRTYPDGKKVKIEEKKA